MTGSHTLTIVFTYRVARAGRTKARARLTDGCGTGRHDASDL